MSFGKTRFNINYEWELLRYCNKLNTSVVGGASKLFKNFLKENNPESVISYSDKSFNTGNLYNMLGFEYSHTSSPNYKYISERDNLILSRYQCQKHKLSNLLKDNFDENLTETENMYNNGFHKIFDCGNDVWIYNK